LRVLCAGQPGSFTAGTGGAGLTPWKKIRGGFGKEEGEVDSVAEDPEFGFKGIGERVVVREFEDGVRGKAQFVQPDVLVVFESAQLEY
jgi:hypothetical protein